jgi:periplasmic protein TonB
VNESLLSRGMPIILSCLLHAGLATALILFGEQWITAVVSARPPVLPVELVVLDALEERRSDAARPAVPPAHEAIRPPKRPAAPRANATHAAVRAEEPSAPEPALLAAVPTPPIESPVAPAPDTSDPGLSASASPPAATAAPATAPAAARSPATTAAAAPSPAPGGVTSSARPQGGYQVRPSYPAAPRRLGIQGTTLLRVHVLSDGRIGDVLIEKTAGHPDLDEAAADAVRRWRFEPARRGSEPVAMWVLLPVEFRLR